MLSFALAKKVGKGEQRRHHRSGWSGLGQTTFQWVVGLVPRLHWYPRVAKYTCVYIVQLVVMWCILLAVVLLLSLQVFGKF